ncbi:MAG: hypothetical protein M1816_000964 [Peltula sp. TS41687]|nr:MAG: hypothetical protein M1816_000964 [Peltula sp. TS41687]
MSTDSPAVGRIVRRHQTNVAAQSGNLSQRSDIAGEINEMDEIAGLKGLTKGVQNQADIERRITYEAEQLIYEQANERDVNRLVKANTEKMKLSSQIETLQQHLEESTSSDVRGELETVREAHSQIEKDISQIMQRIQSRGERMDAILKELTDQSAKRKMPHESQHEFLIRTGKITPFSNAASKSKGPRTLREVLRDAEAGFDDYETSADQPKSRQYLTEPGFVAVEDSEPGLAVVEQKTDADAAEESDSESGLAVAGQIIDTETAKESDEPQLKRTKVSANDVRTLKPPALPSGALVTANAENDDFTSVSESEISSEPASSKKKKRKREVTSKSQKKRREQVEPQEEDLGDLDDGNEKAYQARLEDWASKRSIARGREIMLDWWAKQSETGNVEEEESFEDVNRSAEALEEVNRDEWLMPHPTVPDMVLEGGLQLPGDIHPALFDYQKTGVKWLWELNQNHAGGIIGDEMGLGKTIQAISFLAALHHSGMLKKPVLVVTPATVMKQWVHEFHRWWPPLRVSILHSSGSGMLNLQDEIDMEGEMELESPRTLGNNRKSQARARALNIVNTVIQKGHVLITSYAGLQTYGTLLVPVKWGYAVLDEGHKIRNPNAIVTTYCKELGTENRIILSGTPLQNNLTELWSLFDWIYPMRLGSLPTFRAKFEFPIKMGGYANASNLQVLTASKCAETLKDAISPYLLQRLKADVASDLPDKDELVLFCELTPAQRHKYNEYMASQDVSAILNGRLNPLAGIEMLRKICNHPDLIDRDRLQKERGYIYGHPSKSGKMHLLKGLLETWKQKGHKALVFAQQKIMLNIIEKFVKSLGQFKYKRMDGETPISERQNLIDEFNDNPDINLFLLTTRTGGLGTNLTGADRVVIFDPDWNPSTDTQARERAWRLGQKKPVAIFRLVTQGTIEEKIYHRQIYKQFLARKILQDPTHRQTMPLHHLRDLFTLGRENAENETEQLFQNARVDLEKLRISEGIDPGVAASSSGDVTNDLHGIVRAEQLIDPSEEEAKKADSEDRILEGILARSGVSGVIAHDQIVNGKMVVQADPGMIAREAQRIAADAARELKKAAEAARHIPIGTPTWTGQVGVAGRPGGARSGPSSASVISGLQSTTGAGRGGVNTNGSLRSREVTRWADKIRAFMNVHGGAVPSQMLINQFDRHCNPGKQTADFNEALSLVATLETEGRVTARWVLKDEYKRKR